MKTCFSIKLTILLLLFFGIFFPGCINVVHKAKLNSDGSGTMKIRYWTNSTNVLSDEVSDFGFSEEKVISNYSSQNSSPGDIRIEKNLTADSLAMVTLNLNFNDINKLSNARAFQNVRIKYENGADGKEFKYVLLMDTLKAKSEGMNKYLIYHEFEFPGEIIYTNGNVNTDKKTVSWKNSVADLINDIEMIAIFKIEQ